MHLLAPVRDWLESLPGFISLEVKTLTCCGSSSAQSCAGASSTTAEHSHHSKFQASQTQSMSKSMSTAQRPLVITRFLASTAARSPQPTASMRRAMSSDLARDASFPTRTGKVITPSTRFTVTSSYRIFIRMIHLPEKTLQWNAALATPRNTKRCHRWVLGELIDLFCSLIIVIFSDPPMDTVHSHPSGRTFNKCGSVSEFPLCVKPVGCHASQVNCWMYLPNGQRSSPYPKV